MNPHSTYGSPFKKKESGSEPQKTHGLNGEFETRSFKGLLPY